jgi:hypothetical protein
MQETKDYTSLRIERKYIQAIRDRGLKPYKVFRQALDTFLSGEGHEILYILQEENLREELKHKDDIIEGIDAKIVALKIKRAPIESRRREINKELKKIEKQIKESADNNRKMYLLASINKAIAYHEFELEDIKTVTEEQVKELQTIMPSFNLEKQIDIVRNGCKSRGMVML